MTNITAADIEHAEKLLLESGPAAMYDFLAGKRGPLCTTGEWRGARGFIGRCGSNKLYEKCCI